MDYKGYKLIDKIILVGKTPRSDKEHMQAYLVDPSNKKQLETARNWATWRTYGKDEEGKYNVAFDIIHEPAEFEFDNDGFTLELLDCAGGSSQGGKLSFWNCLVSKDERTFMIGINSDMLLDLLKNATFVNGKCQSPLIFITCKGKVGMTVKGSATYEQCLKDNETRVCKNSKSTARYAFGDLANTTTLNEVYLGTLMQYYEVERDCYGGYRYGYDKYTIKKLAKPKTYHLFESVTPWRRSFSKLSEVIEYYKDGYSLPRRNTSKPKRIVEGKIEMDCSEADFYAKLLDKIYNFEAYKARNNKYYVNMEPARVFKGFLDNSFFGLNKEPFELSEDLMKLVKEYGIKYIDETSN